MELIVDSILVVLLYFPLFPQMVRVWVNKPDFSHGFFIPFISLYFIWRNRNELKNTRVNPSAKGLFILIGGLIFYYLARMGYSFHFQCFSILIVLMGIVYTQAGKEIFKKTCFSIFYLIFMIPLPDIVYTTITFKLRLFATHISFIIIRLMGIDAVRQGTIINLPYCKLVVATPCSGIRSLITFMAASLAIGYIFQKSIGKRITLFIFSIPLAVMLNIVRLVITGGVSHMMKVAEVPASVHDTAGYVVLIMGFVILFAASDILKRVK